ncbi:MAG: ABC transporter substrate-binding protein [Cyanobacteria bacterium P01_D01_bin.116]
MLRDLLEVVKKLFEVSDGLKQAKHEQRQKLENFFCEIEQCLRDSAEVLDNGQIPRIKAKELKVYAKELPNIIGDIYDNKKVSELSNLLKDAANKIATNDSSKDYVEDIETAAAMFKVLAVIVATQTEFNSQNQKKRENLKPLPSLLIKRRNLLFTAAATSVGVIGIGLANEYRQMPNITWRMANFLDESSQLILAQAPKIIRDRIKIITGGRFNIELDKHKSTEEILKKVSNGKVECGFSGIYYNTDKYKVLFFGSSIPHGLTPQEQTAWLLYKRETNNPNNKLTYIQEIYRRKELELNVIPFPAAATGTQMGGWFKKEVENIRDFDGITMRIPGLGGEVLREFNVKLDANLPGGAILTNKISEALKKGKIQAAEWVGPYDDLKLGLHESGAKYYYYPGWWEPSTTFDMVVNQDVWDDLPEQYQEIFKAVCLQTYTEILAEYNQQNSKELEEIRAGKYGQITLRKFSPQILQETERKTQELLGYYASANKLFKEVYDEWQGFKNRIREWSKLS